MSQQLSSSKIPTVQSMDKDTIYQSCMFHLKVVVENRILSNHNDSFIYFTMFAITNFKLEMLPLDFSPLKTWVKMPYLSRLAVPSPTYAENMISNNGGSLFEYFVMF